MRNLHRSSRKIEALVFGYGTRDYQNDIGRWERSRKQGAASKEVSFDLVSEEYLFAMSEVLGEKDV